MSVHQSYDSLMILGPTASGKTKLAVQLAYEWNGEILSADSRMVYKGMDIGTGKDLAEYHVNLIPIPYHLINLVEPNEPFHVFHYQEKFKQAFHQVLQAGKLPVICGGSGLYLEAVLKDYVLTSVPVNPSLKEKLEAMDLATLQKLFHAYPTHTYQNFADILTKKRVIRAIEILDYLTQNPDYVLPASKPIHPFVIGLNPDWNLRRINIETRLLQRLQNGLIEEVETLYAQGVSLERLTFFGLEYKFVSQYLQKQITYEQLVSQLTIAIQQFAKRQMTWFRKMERSGTKIHWVTNQEEAYSLIPTCFSKKP